MFAVIDYDQDNKPYGILQDSLVLQMYNILKIGKQYNPYASIGVT